MTTIKRVIGDDVVPLENDSTAAPQTTIAPAPGDCTQVNNFVPVDETNNFLCITHVVISAANESGTKQQVDVLPNRVVCEVDVTTTHITYTLTVEVKNPFKGKTAAAVLQIPRLLDLLLLEEKHRCGAVTYVPEVMEKQQADEAFRQASASSTHSATLSNTTDEFFEIKIDKIPAGETAILSATFLRTNVRTQAKVMTSADEPAQELMDVVIVPGCTHLSEIAVPFQLTIRSSQALKLDHVSPAVLKETKQDLHNKINSLSTGFNLLALSPTSTSKNGDTVNFTSPGGFACGTVLHARFVRTAENPLVAEMASMSVANTTPEHEVRNAVKAVSRFEGAMFSPVTGSPIDVSLIDVVVPKKVPGFEPCQHQHDIYIIMDTSGSTSMRVDNNNTFLGKCKELLLGILHVLPTHIGFLRDQGLINPKPIDVYLWSFNTYTFEHCKVTLPAGSAEEMSKIIQAQLSTQVVKFASDGCTDFDGWSTKLLGEVSKHPSHLNHVLLLTDGGATSQTSFSSTIAAIRSHPAVGFFQVDALGYGPWLNPSTVSFVTSETNGEAILVETPSGDNMRTKVLGLVARSLLRAASQMTLYVRGGDLLAVQCNTRGVACSQNVLEAGKPYCLSVTPGSRLQLSISHSRDSPLTIAIHHTDVDLDGPHIAQLLEHPAEGDEAFGPTPAQTSDATQPTPNLSKLSDPITRKALKHLLVLEPAYCTQTIYPESTQAKRLAAALRISIKGQIVAPSVTKGCAVAKLTEEIVPVPQHCMPNAPQTWDYPKPQYHDRGFPMMMACSPRAMQSTPMRKSASPSNFRSVAPPGARSAPPPPSARSVTPPSNSAPPPPPSARSVTPPSNSAPPPPPSARSVTPPSNSAPPPPSSARSATPLPSPRLASPLAQGLSRRITMGSRPAPPPAEVESPLFLTRWLDKTCGARFLTGANLSSQALTAHTVHDVMVRLTSRIKSNLEAASKAAPATNDPVMSMLDNISLASRALKSLEGPVTANSATEEQQLRRLASLATFVAENSWTKLTSHQLLNSGAGRAHVTHTASLHELLALLLPLL